MAQISKDHMQEIVKRSIEQDIVECKYSITEINGKKFIQFDTYGSPNREFTNKISQTIQFDMETAHFLIDLLEKEFTSKS